MASPDSPIDIDDNDTLSMFNSSDVTTLDSPGFDKIETLPIAIGDIIFEHAVLSF
jgi:hypothetical protein